MRKIPFWRSLGSAYSFAFGDLATIIGLIWLPMVILFVAGHFAISRYFDSVLVAFASGNRFAIYAGAEYYYLYRLAALLLESVIAVSVMRQALAPRSRSVFVHLALGATELRMFAAFVAASLIMLTIEIAGIVLIVAAAYLFGTVAGTLPPVAGIASTTLALWAALALLAAFFGAIIFITLRLTFLLVPVTVAENKFDLVRSWQLTRGNFWRSFWLTLLVSFPAGLLYLGIQFAFVGLATVAEAPNLSPFSAATAASAQTVALRARSILNWLPYFYGAWFLVRPLTVGLASGAAARAYRALVPDALAVSTPLADGSPAAAST